MSCGLWLVAGTAIKSSLYPPSHRSPIHQNLLHFILLTIMKDFFIAVFSILFFLTIASAAASEPVLDRDGNPLQPGVKYYASFFLWPSNGGVSLASTSNRICPSSVIQRVALPIDTDNGDPITFHPKDSTEEGGIHVSSDLYIEFKDVVNDKCPGESHVWRVNRDESLEQKFDITVGGSVGNPKSVFKIEQSGSNWYKFISCFDAAQCRSVGRVLHDGQMRLVLDDAVPFVVFFAKVPEPASVLQLPKSQPNLICPPGKSAWPELVRMNGKEAAKIIEEENSDVHTIIVGPDTPAIPGDLSCNRVFVIVDAEGFVIRVPSVF